MTTPVPSGPSGSADLNAAIDALVAQAAATKAAVESVFFDLLTKSTTPAGVSEQDIQAAIDKVNSVTADLATLAGEATQADAGTPPPAPEPTPAPVPTPGPGDPQVNPTPSPPAIARELVLRRGLDYTSRIDPGAIRHAGYDFVIRYVDDRPRWKTIDAAEYSELVAAGVDVYLVFEISTDDAEGDSVAGFPNAQRAIDGAHAIGYPDGYPLFFAIDEHVSPDRMDTIRQYLEAVENTVVNRSGFRFGVYGFPEVIAAVQIWYPSAATWQCGHKQAPGFADIWQRNTGTTVVGGITCDVNEQYRPLT